MRHRAVALMAALFAVPVLAQTPPQFSHLLTDSNDYTCVGTVPCATWPMPALPAAGAKWTDPTWGTSIYRLAVPAANPGTAYSTYSRVQAWNSDNTRMFLSEGGTTYLDMYDATTTPPTPINRILTDVSSINSMSNDALWAFTDPKRIYYVPWGGSGHGLELRYVDVSTCTKSSCNLTSHLVHTFGCMTDSTDPLGAGVAGDKIETGSGAQGGMFDNTDRYFSFSCDKVSGDGRHEIDVIRYDRQTDTVTTQEKWYKLCPGGTPSGCKAYAAQGNKPVNVLRMSQHPDHRFITVIWQATCWDWTWSRSCGTDVYDDTYTYLGPASATNTHQDNGFDVNGVPVWVGVEGSGPTRQSERAVAITDLTTLSPTGLTTKLILLPCTFNRSGPGCDSGTFLYAKAMGPHISMTGSWGTLKGYALWSSMEEAGPAFPYPPQYPAPTTLGTDVLAPGTLTVTPASMNSIGVGVVSTVGKAGADMESVTWTATTATTATATFSKAHSAGAAVSCLSCGDTGFDAMENVAIKIDTTAPGGSDAQFWRIGRTMAIRDKDYNAEPHTAVNRDFTQITWGSSWNVDPGSAGKIYGFWTKLGGPFPTSITISPASATIAAKATKQFICTAVYSDSSESDCTTQATWTSSDTTKSTVSSGGLAAGLAAGILTIKAAWGGVTGTATLTITAQGLTGITITPATASIVAEVGTQQYNARCNYSNGSTSDCTGRVTWSSSNQAVTTISSLGFARAGVAGTAVIKAASRSISGSSALTVINAAAKSSR